MPAAIVVEGIERAFGEVRAVQGVDLEVEEGEIYGFLGPNGAGKTTTVRMLTTLLLPTGGRATVAGHDVVHEARAVRGSIGVAPATFVFLIGAGFPGIDGLLIAYPMVVLMAAFAACWDAMLALVFLTPAYAPLAPLQGGSTTWPRSTR